jgi:hypothetical protein
MRQGREILVSAIKLLLLSVASIFVLGFGFELYLRSQGFLLSVPANYPCVTGHPLLNHVYKENCQATALAAHLKTEKDVIYKTNSIGLRGPEPIAKARKIVMIGDSYTEGFGLAEEESLPFLVEAAWKKSGAKNLQVINGGTIGFSTAVYPLFYKNKISPLKPEFVLLNLDFTDITDDPYFLQIAEYDENGLPKSFAPKESFPSWLLPLVYSNRSALFRFLHQEWNQWSLYKLKQINKEKMNAYAGASPVSPSFFEISGMQSCIKPLSAMVRSIRRLNDMVRADGARFAIHMYLPGTMVKKYPDQKRGMSIVRSWLQKKEKDHSWYCAENIGIVDFFRAFSVAENIPFFDSSKEILKNPSRESFYFPQDAHWNFKGTSFVANILSRPLWRLIESKK